MPAAKQPQPLRHNQHLRIRSSMQPAAIIDEVVFHFWKARLGRSLRSFPLATTAHNIRIHIGVNKITVEVPGSHKWRSWLLFRVLSTAETVVNWALVSGPPMSRAEVPWHRADLWILTVLTKAYIYIYTIARLGNLENISTIWGIRASDVAPAREEEEKSPVN